MMSARELFTFRNRHFSTAVGVVAGVFVLSAVAGFAVLPRLQPEMKYADFWDALCSAAGRGTERDRDKPWQSGSSAAS